MTRTHAIASDFVVVGALALESSSWAGTSGTPYAVHLVVGDTPQVVGLRLRNRVLIVAIGERYGDRGETATSGRGIRRERQR